MSAIIRLFLKDGKPVLRNAYVAGIIMSWVAAFFWSILPMMGLGKYGVEPQGTSCIIDWLDKSDATITYLSTLTILGFILPAFLGFMALHMANLSVSDEQEKSLLKRNNKLVNNLFIYSMVFWTPFTLLIVVNLIHPLKSIPLIVAYSAPLAAKCGTTMLPIIYDAVLFRYHEVKSKST